MPPKKSENLLTYRVEQLEKDYKSLSDKLDLLLTNHLPHIQAELASVRTEQRVLAALNVGAVIIAVIVSNYIAR